VTRTELGRRAELAVADLLFASGFELLARNLRLGPLELDVVARKGPLLVMTEVRTRGPGSFVGPFASIGRTKRAHLFAAARRLWRSKSAWTKGVERVRIDVAAVTFAGIETYVEYVPGALG
jgi:putative endonuclease